MRLDLTAFARALAQVEEALAFSRSELALSNDRLALQFRASAIQSFEYTYELAYKSLFRYLEATEPAISQLDRLSFQDIIRLAYERGLIQAELRAWLDFRKNRGTTSHTYDEEKADQVFSAIPAFLTEATFLYHEIERRQQSTNA